VPILSDEHFARAPGDTRDGLQERHGLLLGSQSRREFGVQTRNGGIQVLQMSKLLVQQEDMVRLHPTHDRLGEGLPFGPQPPARELGQRLCVRLALEQPQQDLACRKPAHIGDDGSELDDGVLEHGLQSVGEPCSFVNQVETVAREVAQIAQMALRRRWNEAGAQQPVAQQVRQPLGVLDIGLATGNRLDVIGIDDEDLALLFQQVEHRTPVRPRRLHDHRPTIRCSQPVGERQQIVGHGAVGAHLLVDRPIRRRHQQAGHDKPLVNIQPAAALVHHPYDIPRSSP